jgi:hypothetical protein
MPPDPMPLATAARRNREHAQAHARIALRELDQQGRPISFRSVARRVGVSRQWLCTQTTLCSEIMRLRDRPRFSDGVPAGERATEASLRQRVETLGADNQRLRGEHEHQRRAGHRPRRPAGHAMTETAVRTASRKRA